MATYKQINTLTNNKRKLLEYAGYKSIKAYRKDFPYFRNDESAYKFLLGEYNDIIDMLNEQEIQKKEAEKKRIKAYHKDKRASDGNYMKGNYKLLQSTNKIDKIAKYNKTTKKKEASDLDRYMKEKGVFIREVRVYYDCEQKDDDWTEDQPKWKKPFRTYRAELVIGNSINDLNERSTYTAEKLKTGLEKISPEQNTNFEIVLGKEYNSNRRVPLSKIKMKACSPLKLNGEPLPHFEMGQGLCVYDALFHIWEQPNSKMERKANMDYLNDFFMDFVNDPLHDGIDTDTLVELAKLEEFSLYAFDIHNKLITKYSSERTRQSKKPPLIYRLYNEHMYLICDKAVQASLIASNRNAENIRHIDIENDKYAKKEKQDEPKYTNIIADEKLTGNEFVYDYIMNSGEVPFPFTKKNINYDKGHINSMKIGNKHIFTKPIEEDIITYLEDNNEEYNGQHYINLLMKKWKEQFGCELNKNELISHMNPIVCDLLNEENVKMRTHYGSMMNLPVDTTIEGMIDNGTIIGADLIKCYSSILDNPLDDWLVYGLTDEVEEYNGQLKTGLYFVETHDITILHKTNWYSNTIIKYAIDEGIELKIIRQYIPSKQKNNRGYFKEFINYVSTDCNIKLTKNILNSLTGMFGKTKSSAYNISITTDINEVWNCLQDGCDKLDNFVMKDIGKDRGTSLYVYGFKNKTNIYTNNLPMYIQILDQSNIKLHQLAKSMGGEVLFRKTDAVMVYGGSICPPFDKNLRENWGKHTLLTKDELRKYNYKSYATTDRYVINRFENGSDGWNCGGEHLKSSSQYKEIVEYAIANGGLMICSRAGTGKSYVVQKAVEDGLIDDDKRTRLAFTNKARRNINGSTIHSAISLNSDTEKASMKMIQTYKGKKVIIVDEISMLSKQLWTQLINMKRISGAVFIIIGDYRQLPAVESEDNNYFDSSIVRYLANNNRIELTERQRYDKELWDFLEAYWERGEIGTNLCFSKDIDFNAYNICYFNKTRVAVNKLYMEHFKPDNSYFIPHDKIDIDDRASGIYIYEGLPVMAIVNKTKAKKGDDTEHQSLYCNSDTMKVIRYTDKIITMKLDIPDENGNELIDVKVNDFHKSFVCNYCSTTHKNQGATIERNIQLWDWNQMKKDRRIAYTAISRAKRIQQIQVVA